MLQTYLLTLANVHSLLSSIMLPARKVRLRAQSSAECLQWWTPNARKPRFNFKMRTDLNIRKWVTCLTINQSWPFEQERNGNNYKMSTRLHPPGTVKNHLLYLESKAFRSESWGERGTPKRRKIRITWRLHCLTSSPDHASERSPVN